MYKIEINTSDNFNNMAEDVALNVISKLVNKETGNIDYLLKIVTAYMGEEVAEDLKKQLMKLINNNIVGMKNFVVGLTEFLATHEGKKFNINIEEANEE